MKRPSFSSITRSRPRPGTDHGVARRRAWRAAGSTCFAVALTACGGAATTTDDSGAPRDDASSRVDAHEAGSSSRVDAGHGSSSSRRDGGEDASSSNVDGSLPLEAGPGVPDGERADVSSPADAVTPHDAMGADDATEVDAGLRDASQHDSATAYDGEAGNVAPVDLGTAANYVILSETGISTVSPSTIVGNLGVSPAAATYITGFSLIADPSNVFSTSSQVTGKIYAADYAAPTPTNLTTAIGDMGAAFTAAAGRAPSVTGLGAGSIGGMTLHEGVYRWGTGLLLATDVTLTGGADDVWIFQVAKGLTVSSGVHLTLAGGAQAKNVFWQVSGSVTLATTVKFEGTILCQTAIALDTGASITGRLLAQTAVTLDDDSVVVAP